ncbi:unnamed protein product [Brachionus calyciflorus]|uniref:Uncharacterized protein n=1 Tax=Brachionus calyciflorus TaxID=104777 RepID=A0A814PK85_9BILA|nr:unnamed protein product [Brachionus calyciflorus]
MLIRFLNVSFESTRVILKELNLLGIQKCHEWVLTITFFYEELPDLEKEAKEFALSKACSKKFSFDFQSLANFIEKRFRLMCPDNDLSEDEIVRPFFGVHEREDVVFARKELLQYLLDSKDFYYCPHYENGILKWMEPSFVSRRINFQRSFHNHSIEIIVDNARTHTTKVYDPKLFNKFPGTNCVYQEIKWEENNHQKSPSYFDESGIYKGLIRICKELNLIESNVNSKEISLEKLREIILMHPAFEVDCTYLERLASSNDHKVLFFRIFIVN